MPLGNLPTGWRIYLEGQPMATRIETTLIDDLDGTTAEETVRFSLDGTEYEIDLNEEHAAELRSSVRHFTDSARKAPATRRRTNTPTAAALGRERTRQIRAWAQAEGIPVNNRGRVNASIVDAYEKAHTS